MTAVKYPTYTFILQLQILLSKCVTKNKYYKRQHVISKLLHILAVWRFQYLELAYAIKNLSFACDSISTEKRNCRYWIWIVVTQHIYCNEFLKGRNSLNYIWLEWRGTLVTMNTTFSFKWSYWLVSLIDIIWLSSISEFLLY